MLAQFSMEKVSCVYVQGSAFSKKMHLKTLVRSYASMAFYELNSLIVNPKLYNPFAVLEIVFYDPVHFSQISIETVFSPNHI